MGYIRVVRSTSQENTLLFVISQLPRPLIRSYACNGVFTLEPWRRYILDVTICVWIRRLFSFLSFFFCGRYMILSRIEGGFAKKKKKGKEEGRGEEKEIGARSRPVDHGSHESGTAWQTKEVFERRIPHLFKRTDWNGKGHGGVGWLVGWLVTRLEEGVGSVPFLRSKAR